MKTKGSGQDAATLDEVVDQFGDQISRLPTRAAGIFSTCICERIANFYGAFAARHSPPEATVIRDALDATWQHLCGSLDGLFLRKHLEPIERATPATPKFRTLDSVLAQNVCIAVDATIRTCLGERDMAALASQFCFEAIAAAVSHKETGFIDLGSGPQHREFESRLLTHPIVCAEIGRQRSDLAELSKDAIPDEHLILRLRQSAMDSRIVFA